MEKKLIINFISCIKIKKIRVPKFLIYKIIDSCGFRYYFGFDLVKHEKPEIIFIEACKICNFVLIDNVLDKIEDINIGLFIGSYYNLTNLIEYFSKKNIANKNAVLHGKTYRSGSIYPYMNIRKNERLETTLSRLFRGVCHYDLFRDIYLEHIDYTTSIRKEITEILGNCHSCDPGVRCSVCLLNLNEGLFGACEAGQLGNVIALVEHGAKGLNKGLYLSKKYGHPEISEYLISKGARPLLFIIKTESDKYYEIISHFKN